MAALSGFALQASRFEVSQYNPLKIVSHGNLAGFTSLVHESQAVLVPGVEEVANSQSGDGSDAGRGIDQDRDDRAVSKTNDVAGVDGVEQPTRLFDRDLGRLALDDLQSLAANGRRRVQDDCVPGDENIEQMSDGSQIDFLGSGGIRQRVEVGADMFGADRVQFQLTLVAPGEELAAGTLVRSSRVLVSQAAVDELVPGELRRLAGRLDEGRRAAGGIHNRRRRRSGCADDGYLRRRAIHRRAASVGSVAWWPMRSRLWRSNPVPLDS